MATDIELSSEFFAENGLRTDLNSRGDLIKVSGDSQRIQRLVLRCFEVTEEYKGGNMTIERRVELKGDLEENIENDEKLPDDTDVRVISDTSTQVANEVVVSVVTDFGNIEIGL